MPEQQLGGAKKEIETNKGFVNRAQRKEDRAEHKRIQCSYGTGVVRP